MVPVGPGHEELAGRAQASIIEAWKRRAPRPFSFLHIEIVNDSEGKKGRSRARNEGVERCPEADWFFLLDADDLMEPLAMRWMRPEFDATYGPAKARVRTRGAYPRERVAPDPPKDWDALMRQGPINSLMMGNFYRGDALRAHPFREDLDFGEDWEHHLSFMAKHSWALSEYPLAMADCTTKSAGGPRGGSRNWEMAAEPFFDFWRTRGRVPLTEEQRKRDYWV